MADTSIKLTGSWEKAIKILNTTPENIAAAADKAMEAEAQLLRGAIVRKFRDLTPPQSAFTAMTGGTGKPLQRTGNLKGSIGAVKLGGGYFIGVPASSGKWKLATIHEFGQTIIMRMTDKQRRFLFAIFGEHEKPGGASGTGLLVIRIPARPFVGPTFAEQGPKIPKRFKARLSRILKQMGTDMGD